MHYMRDGIVFDDLGHRQLVPQVNFLENVLRMLRDFLQVDQMPGVGQAIQIHQSGNLMSVNDVVDEVGADEACAAGDKKVHCRGLKVEDGSGFQSRRECSSASATGRILTP